MSLSFLPLSPSFSLSTPSFILFSLSSPSFSLFSASSPSFSLSCEQVRVALLDAAGGSGSVSVEVLIPFLSFLFYFYLGSEGGAGKRRLERVLDGLDMSPNP